MDLIDYDDEDLLEEIETRLNTQRKNILQNTITKYRDKYELDTYDTSSNLAKAISVEAGELLQEHLWTQSDIDEKKVKEELGDVLIYAIALCNYHGWDYRAVVNSKIVLNKARGYHGNTKHQKQDNTQETCTGCTRMD